MASDLTPAVRRFFRLRPGIPGPMEAEPEMTETTVDLAHAALQHQLDIAENRLLGAVSKVDAVLARTEDRRHRDHLLDIRLRLTGGTSI